ncbi:trehalose-phosphatase [Halorientalis halophila]|uniref:trehalose-phosphatase n=1 Tax=Halorientalis halophila TaxID=3108499 RepID=UPI003008B5F7
MTASDEIAGRLAAGTALLVATDFDGTLAPIAEDPSIPEITPANARVLGRLAAHPDAVVAIVSGRELVDLRGRVALEGAIYAGNHGLELQRGAETVVHPTARRRRPAIDRARRILARELGDVPGCSIEDKSLSLTVHYRRVPPDVRPTVPERIDELAPALGEDVHLVPGRESVEVRPRVEWDKGRAVEWIAADLPAGHRTIYLGDDTTDEDVFRTLRPVDVGVRVGTDATDAEFRLDSQRAVAPFLDWLAETVFRRPVG